MQPARGCHRQTRDISDHRPQAAVAQAFLHAGQHRDIIAGLDIDHPIRPKTCLPETGREQVRLRHAPEHLSRHPRDNAGRKAGGGCPIHRTVAATRYLMQAAKRQTASGQPAIQLRQAEGQHAACRPAVSFHPRDLLAQGGNGRVEGPGRHEGDSSDAGKNEQIVFLFCSVRARGVNTIGRMIGGYLRDLAALCCGWGPTSPGLCQPLPLQTTRARLPVLQVVRARKDHRVRAHDRRAADTGGRRGRCSRTCVWQRHPSRP